MLQSRTRCRRGAAGHLPRRVRGAHHHSAAHHFASRALYPERCHRGVHRTSRRGARTAGARPLAPGRTVSNRAQDRPRQNHGDWRSRPNSHFHHGAVHVEAPGNRLPVETHGQRVRRQCRHGHDRRTDVEARRYATRGHGHWLIGWPAPAPTSFPSVLSLHADMPLRGGLWARSAPVAVRNRRRTVRTPHSTE